MATTQANAESTTTRVTRVDASSLRALGRLGIALTVDEVEEFRRLLAQLTGREVAEPEAREKATALLLFMQSITADSPAYASSIAGGGGHGQ